MVGLIDGVDECIDGAEVVLKKDGSEVGRVTSDIFGEFKIDKLEPSSGAYELEVSGSAGKLAKSFELGADSVYLGVLELA